MQKEQVNKFQEFIANINYDKIIASIAVIIVSIILYKIVTAVLTKGEKNDKLAGGKKGKTYIRLLKNVVRNVFIIVTVLIILQINGVNVSSLLAGVGIAGVIVGLAIQDWLKDIIRGATILSDHYFAVGDIVKFNNIEGQVVVIGLRTTKVRDNVSGNFISIANRNIEKVEIISGMVYLNIPLPYEVKLEKAEKVINEIVKNIKDNVENVVDAKYLGVNELADSSINYLIQVETKSIVKRQVKRDSLGQVLTTLERNNISVPYKQLDVHQK